MPPDSHFHTKRDELEVFWVPADESIPCELKVIKNNYAGLQNIVGGYVTPYPFVHMNLDRLSCGCDLAILVDEEGMMKRLELNVRANYMLTIGAYSPILGDAIVVAQGPLDKRRQEYDFWGLPEEMNHWPGPGHPLPVAKG